MLTLSENTHPPIISIAPMMDWTDRHERYFLRLFSPAIQLYTEMITTQALLHCDPARFLAIDPKEKYVALQLGGSNPAQLGVCAKLGEEFGYDEINLNVGCPSPRVSSGRFGACLMLEPALVEECVAAMSASVSIPVTVKCRIGVDTQDDFESLVRFIHHVMRAGCKTVIIHARKAWLSGLSPKENREIPPLRYDVVYEIKKIFPTLQVIINGGIKTIADIDSHLPHVDGVMIGRAAYSNPYWLAAIHERYFAADGCLSRHDIIHQFLPYVETQLKRGQRLGSMTRHILGLFQGQSGAARWRRYLSENAHLENANIDVIRKALALV